jgi:hypothetical protein
LELPVEITAGQNLDLGKLDLRTLFYSFSVRLQGAKQKSIRARWNANDGGGWQSTLEDELILYKSQPSLDLDLGSHGYLSQRVQLSPGKHRFTLQEAP